MTTPWDVVNTIDLGKLRAMASREVKDIEEVTLVVSEHGFYSVPLVVIFPIERYNELIDVYEKLRLAISQLSLLTGMDDLARESQAPQFSVPVAGEEKSK